MADTGRLSSSRFFPEMRGWAALRLAAFIPRSVREEIRTCLEPQGSAVSFEAAALALVSRPVSIAWSREVAARIPALGVAAGPATIARLWLAKLLDSNEAMRAYWPSAVDAVWKVVRPSLEKLGVSVCGPGEEDMRHEVAAPLALVLLKSLASGRKDLRLVGLGGDGPIDGPPLGWAPGIDPLPALIRYLAMNQAPGRFRSHAFMSSPLARLVRVAGIAVPVLVNRGQCDRCRISLIGGGGRCPHCGRPLALRRLRRLVARQTLTGCVVEGRAGTEEVGAASSGDSPVAGLSVPDRVVALEAHRQCMERARRLWVKVLRGRRANVSAMVVLGVLAGVDPLIAVADRPPPRSRWLERLVELLIEGRLDREPLAQAASAAVGTVAERLGLPRPPTVAAAYLGVLAARFRHAVLGRRDAGVARL